MTTHKEIALEFEKRRMNVYIILHKFTIKEYADVSVQNDARLTLLIKSIEALTNLEIGLMNIFNITQDPEWIKKYPFNLRNDDHNNVRYSHEMFFKIAFIHIYFSVSESSFRAFLKSIDPSACNNSTAEFESIYVVLLKRLALKQYIPFLDVLRCIRNTIHNNGTFFPIANKDKHIVYSGRKYDFCVGKPQENTSWTDLLSIVDETTLVIENVLKTPIIMNMTSIEDPFTSQVWPKYLGEQN